MSFFFWVEVTYWSGLADLISGALLTRLRHRILGGCKASKQCSQQLQVPSTEGGTTSVGEDAAGEGSNAQADSDGKGHCGGEHERLRC